jgi:hypothetical protein
MLLLQVLWNCKIRHYYTANSSVKLIPHRYTEPQHNFQHFALSRQWKSIGAADVGFGVLTAVVMNVLVFLDIAPFSCM